MISTLCTELVDSIADHVDDSKSLKALSLASSNFVTSSQSRLFRSMAVAIAATSRVVLDEVPFAFLSRAASSVCTLGLHHVVVNQGSDHSPEVPLVVTLRLTHLIVPGFLATMLPFCETLLREPKYLAGLEKLEIDLVHRNAPHSIRLLTAISSTLRHLDIGGVDYFELPHMPHAHSLTLALVIDGPADSFVSVLSSTFAKISIAMPRVKNIMLGIQPVARWQIRPQFSFQSRTRGPGLSLGARSVRGQKIWD
ncbi:hypothetical protein C8J57DRAFT_1234731 [Mycena rebaudengoi]|nr:hypothetical protein C8J57DRAFT_1234731 [Mycena rebaudengoi]